MRKSAVAFGAVAVVVVAGLVALPALFMQTNKAGAENEMRRVMVEGKLPMTTQELYPAPSVPEAQNAFAMIGQISEASKRPGMVQAKAPARGKDWDIAELRKSVNAHHDMLAFAEVAASRPEWQPVRTGDGPNISFPEFATVKNSVKALAERTRLRAADGDFAGAVKDSESALNLGDLVRKEPVLIAGLVSIASHAIAYTTIADVAHQVRRDPAAFDSLVRLAERPVHNDFHRLFMGEATMSYYMATHRADWLQDFGMGGSNNSPQAKLQSAKIELDRPYWGPILVKGWASYLAETKKNPANIGASEAALKKLGKLAESKDDRLLALNYMFPVFSQAFEAYRKESAQRDLLQIGLSAMRDGGLPDVKGSKDPFSGEPYRVLKSAEGWKVYSLGTDRRDDKGTYTVGTIDDSKTKNDIVFTWDGTRASLKGR